MTTNSIPKPQRKRWYKRWWVWPLFFLLVVIASSVFAGVSAWKNRQQNAYAYLNDTIVVSRRDVQRTISTSGTIVPDAIASLSVPESGTVSAIIVVPGQAVQKNDVLMKIDLDPVGSAEIKARFDGRIIAVNTFVGDQVTPQAPVLELGYNTSHIEFYASDSEAIALKTNQSVIITVPSYENGTVEYSGEVVEVDMNKQTPQMTKGGQTTKTGYRVKVSTGDLPEDVTTRVGLTVDMEILIAEVSDALSLQRGVVQFDGAHNPFVYLPVTIDKQFIQRAASTEDVTTLLEKKSITLGFEGDDYVEVTHGLTEGEEVLFYIPAQQAASPF